MGAKEKSIFKNSVMQNHLSFITGGARSGKTRYAQEQALIFSQNPVYIATAKTYVGDDEFQKRVERHKADRDDRWLTIEEHFHISNLALDGKVVVIDCVTLWLTNFFSLYKSDVNESLMAIKKEIDAIKEIAASFFIVSNEIGMGIHAPTEVGRRFTDLQGWTNQYIAQKANEVVLLVSGIPVTIKR
jgi:adenosylcobinamide kinase/adenosylcobinamide-phosphate guanylyltransferase